jgi:ferredoxin-NADP reductase
VGDKVGVRVGGSFVLRPAPSNLFVAGGVGINPLFGMLRQLFELPEGTSKAVLLYTARTRDELVFAH